jgi:hypothetical protein
MCPHCMPLLLHRKRTQRHTLMTNASRYPRYTDAKRAVKERMRAICRAFATANLLVRSHHMHST